MIIKGSQDENKYIQWVGSNEASEYLGLTLRTLYRLIDEGQVPCYQFGRVYRLKKEDLDQLIENCRVKPGKLRHLYPDLSKNDPNNDAN